MYCSSPTTDSGIRRAPYANSRSGTAVTGPADSSSAVIAGSVPKACDEPLPGSGSSHAFGTEPTITALLLSAGPVTAVPLLLFAYGARRIPLSVVGLLQYIGPSIQLALGVWLYGEPFGGARLLGFGLIWAGLALYSAEGLWRGWRAVA